MQPKGLFKFLRLEGFFQNVTDYVENRIAIAKLDAKQKIADIGSTVAAMVPAALFGLFALTFLSLTLAQALNVWLDSRVWGFLIVGVIYGIAAYAMFSMRNADWLKKKIVDGSTKFLKDKPQKDQNGEAVAPEGYHAPQVEHTKVIFEEAEEEDREVYTADRPPVPRHGETTEVIPHGNAAIIVHDEVEEEKERS